MSFSSPSMAQASMGMQSAGAISSVLGSSSAAKAANQQRQFSYDTGVLNAQSAKQTLDWQYDTGAVNAQSTKQTLLYQADVADINASHATFVGDTNARIAELGAQSALEQGQRQVGALTLKAGQLKSSQRAAMAANGIDLGEGSAAEVQASTDTMKEIDSNTITANAVRAAMGYKTQAVEATNTATQQALNYKTSADFSRVAAENSKAPQRGVSAAAPQRGVDTSALSAAGTSLLASASSVSASWYQMNKVGAGTTPAAVKETVIPDSYWSYP